MTFDTSVTLELPEELMAACNIRNIDQSLLRKMKVRAAEEGLTLRDWSIRAFVQALEVKYGDKTGTEMQLREGDVAGVGRPTKRGRSSLHGYVEDVPGGAHDLQSRTAGDVRPERGEGAESTPLICKHGYSACVMCGFNVPKR